MDKALLWIQLLLLSVAATALIYSLWHFRPTTPKRSVRSSSAEDAWRTEYDLELAELKSTVAGLSSTLRKLHGRESQRLRKDSPGSESPITDKNELRQRFGILPSAK